MKHTFRLITGAALFATLTACQSPAGGSPSHDMPMELKVYQVPNEQTADLARALNNSMAARKGSATMAKPGELLVYAPRDEQASIGEAIQQVTKLAPGSSLYVPLRANFWMIEAQPGSGSDDPALAPLTNTLKALRASMGPQHFTLQEFVSGIASDDTSLIRTGSGHVFKFKWTPADQEISLHVSYSDLTSQTKGISDLDTTVTIERGQYLVLAQAPAIGLADMGKLNTAPQATRLLVVRVDFLNSPN